MWLGAYDKPSPYFFFDCALGEPHSHAYTYTYAYTHAYNFCTQERIWWYHQQLFTSNCICCQLPWTVHSFFYPGLGALEVYKWKQQNASHGRGRLQPLLWSLRSKGGDWWVGHSLQAEGVNQQVGLQLWLLGLYCILDKKKCRWHGGHIKTSVHFRACCTGSFCQLLLFKR